MDTVTRENSILSCLNWGASYLDSHGVDDSRINTERILMHLLGASKAEIYLDGSKEVDVYLRENFSSLIRRRALRYPLQYLLGSTEFFGLDFEISDKVLIPRPETEILVEKSLSFLYSKQDDRVPLRVLDLGTGSGNIAVSIAKLNPQTKVTAVDISAYALEVAEKNAAYHGAQERINFLKGNLFGPINKENKFDLIVSNPPYVSHSDLCGLAPELSYEPRIALDGGEDGLFYIRKIIKNSPRYLQEEGVLIMEIGFGQIEAVREIFLSSEFKDIEIEKDYQGIDRVVIFRK